MGSRSGEAVPSRKPYHCSVCGEAGHTFRGCYRWSGTAAAKVRCPWCGARVGMPCVTADGERLPPSRAHAWRVSDARERRLKRADKISLARLGQPATVDVASGEVLDSGDTSLECGGARG